MSIINLTTKEKYQLDDQAVKFVIKTPKDFFEYFDCYNKGDRQSGMESSSDNVIKRIRKVWKTIDIFLVESSQSNKTVSYDGNKIHIPDINDTYISIETKLNDSHLDRRVQYTRYFDGLDRYDNECFGVSDAEMLQRGHELKMPFGKDFIPQGCSVDEDGYRVWFSADEYSVYYRRSKGAWYGHSIFIWSDRIMERVRNNPSDYEATTLFEILKCKAQAIMDVDFATCHRSGTGNYLLRTIQPAFFRLRENGLANAIAYFFINQYHPKNTEYADKCSTVTYWKADGIFSHIFRKDPNDLPLFISRWINTKYIYAQSKQLKRCSDNQQLYQKYNDSIVNWFNLAIEIDDISQKHIPMLSDVEKEMEEMLINNDAINDNNTMKNMKDVVVESTKPIIPKDIKEYLDRYVIGQDKAKRALCVAVYNHYKRIGMNLGRNEDNQLAKSNLIMIGETGSGKTLLAKTIARYLDVPIFIQDCTKITEAGYVGQDVEECLKGLLMAAGGDILRAERGIIVLDEVDKLASCNAGASITRDVAGEGVQQALLKIVEGDKVQVQQQSGRRHPEAKCDIIDTTNILFIATGAFPGIDSIIRKRFGAAEVGFCTNNAARDKNADFTSMVCAEDFRQFGFIPEFIGRFPITTNVNKLNEEDFIRILTEPADSIIAQYTDMLAEDNTKLIFTDDALHSIAHYSLLSRTGARGLRGVIENILGDIMFDAPSNRYDKDSVTVVIDQDYVEQKINHNLIPNKAI